MLEVHPPHEPVHGWRDVVVHLLTITAGLLIALGLEAAVEAVHHHRLAAEARENIRHEMAQNASEAAKNVESLRRNSDAMMTNIGAMRERLVARRRGEAAPAKSNLDLHFNYGFQLFSDSAWRTARDTGALSHMPAAEVQALADVYQVQELANREGSALMTLEGEALAPLLAASRSEGEPAAATADAQDGGFLAEDLHAAMLRSADVKMRVALLGQLVAGLRKEYADALAAEPAR
jgi:hypothetical protein